MPAQTFTITSETTMADLQEAMAAGFRINGGHLKGGAIEGDYTVEQAPVIETVVETVRAVDEALTEKHQWRQLIEQAEALLEHLNQPV